MRASLLAVLSALVVLCVHTHAQHGLNTKELKSYAFSEALREMPEWPKMVIFLDKDTPRTHEAFEWHKTLTKEMGQRLMVMAVVNNTEKEAAIMRIFQLTKPDQLPTIQAIKAGTVDLSAGEMEVLRTSVQPTQWNLDKARELAQRAALKPLHVQAKFLSKPANLQVTDVQTFYKRCIQETGRCAIYFVNIDKYKQQLEVMSEAMMGMETYFYKFHPMWADISIAKSVFNFPQVDQTKTPQLVILDAKEKVFAPQLISEASAERSAEKIRKIFNMFDQPNAMKRIRDGMKKGASTLATQQTNTMFGTHTEL